MAAAGRSRVRSPRALAVMLGVAVLVLAADIVSKNLVLEKLPGQPPVRLLDGLITLRLTYNAGAAFGFGTSYTVIIALIACAVIFFLIRTARRLRSIGWSIALGLVLGGAAGNLCDRLFRAPGPLRGEVVDWINLPHFPWTFNIADSAIVCGAVLIALLALRDVHIDGTPRRLSGTRPGGAASTGPRQMVSDGRMSPRHGTASPFTINTTVSSLRAGTRRPGQLRAAGPRSGTVTA